MTRPVAGDSGRKNKNAAQGRLLHTIALCKRVGGWHGDPCRGSLGLLPSGPDPVGEWLVHHQPPERLISDAPWGLARGGQRFFVFRNNVQIRTARLPVSSQIP